MCENQKIRDWDKSQSADALRLWRVVHFFVHFTDYSMRLRWRQCLLLTLSIFSLLYVLYTRRTLTNVLAGVRSDGESAKSTGPFIPADWSRQSLRARLLAHFRPKSYEIPAHIWQSWKSKVNLDAQFKKNVEEWVAQDGFEYSLLDDEEVGNFVESEFADFPEVLRAWNTLPRKILKADFFRYLILLSKGGYYSDIDTNPTSELKDWLTEGTLGQLRKKNKNHVGVIIGLEDEADLGTWRGLYNRRINLCQWTMASRPGHPLFVDIVSKITDLAINYYDERENVITFPLGYKNLAHMTPKYNMSKDSPNWYEGIIEWTGPAAFTDSFFQIINGWYLENFGDRLLGSTDEVLCNNRGVCVLDPNKPLNLLSKVQNYPLGDNLLGIKLPEWPLGWENLTLLEFPVIYGDVAVLPKNYFNSLYAKDGKKGYVHHGFTGTWKWTQDP